MNKSILLSLLFCVSYYNHSFAQAQAYKVTESTPITINGLTMGFNIKSTEEKEVGSKGNFSRYSIQFYVTNPGTDPKIILYREGNIDGNVNSPLAQFNCLNATGARLTSKSAIITAMPCKVVALVDDKDCNGKIIQNKRFVQIGSWIMAGQTITTSAIVIVPLNQRPDMQVQYLANLVQPTSNYDNGNTGYNQQQQDHYDNNSTTRPASQQHPGDGYDNTGTMRPGVGAQQNSDNYNNGAMRPAPQQQGPPPPPIANMSTDFTKIMNVSKGTYINNQQGQLSCGNIDNGWWSAQWKLVPVMGGNYYIIKNKQTGTFISTEDPTSMLSNNYNTKASMWIIEPVDNTNLFFLRNVNDGTYLNFKFGRIQTSTIGNNTDNAKWTLVQ